MNGNTAAFGHDFLPIGAGRHIPLAEIVPWVTGVDTLGLQLALALGKTFDAPDAPLRGAVLDFPKVEPGRLAAIHGWERITRHADTLFAMKLKGVGETVEPLRSGADRVAAIAVRGETADAAQATLDGFYETLDIVTRPERAVAQAHA